MAGDYMYMSICTVTMIIVDHVPAVGLELDAYEEYETTVIFVSTHILNDKLSQMSCNHLVWGLYGVTPSG